MKRILRQGKRQTDAVQAKRISAIIRILSREYRRYEEPSVTKVSRTEDPFKVLISCLISLRTKDEVTYPASQRLFTLAVTPKAMMKLSTRQIEKAIYPAGFYITKAKRIKDIARIIHEKYKDKVPDTIEELLKLHGVGRKTANIVVTLAYNKNGIAVDTHVHRLSNRLGLIKTKNPHKTEFALLKILPEKYWIIYNDLLVSHGQNTCRPISPFCSRCKISEFCDKINVISSR
ncbi:endonuclease III [Candidatus Woesearchaeota archaeon]|nr:endonuclease III [Candidatus Woesearchaeota archaeon]